MTLFRTIVIVVAVVWSLIAGDLNSAFKGKPKEVVADEVSSLELKLKTDPDNPIILQGLGRYYFRTDNMEAAREYALRLLEYAKRKEDREFSEMWGRYILGAVQSSLGESKDALRNLEIARGIAESEENKDALSLIYNTLGIYYMFNNNDPFTATAFYYKALDNTRKEKDFQREAPLLANLAAAYLVMEDPSGLKLAEQAVELSEKYDREFTIKPRIILAETYILVDSIENARHTLEDIRLKESESNKAQFMSTIQYIEASLAAKEGRWDEAIEIFRDLLNYEKEDPSWVASVSLELAAVLEKKGFNSEAISILERAIQNSRATQVHIHSSKLMKSLVRLYAKVGLNENAIAMGELYVAYSDSIYTLGHHRTLQENRIREEVYTREREIDEQKLQLVSKNNRISLLTIGIGLLSVLLIFIFAANRKKERLYKTIVARNSEFIKIDRLQKDEILSLRQKVSLNSQNKTEEVERLDKTDIPEENTHEDLSTPVADNKDQNAVINSNDQKVAVNNKDQDKDSDNTRELMQRFVAYLETDNGYSDPHITIANVARKLGTNRTYLSKAINVATGKTFTQIINDYRMRRAVEVLSDKDSAIPLKQLAADLGYNSMSTFYSLFNNYTGMTPAKYREHVHRIAEESPESNIEM